MTRMPPLTRREFTTGAAALVVAGIAPAAVGRCDGPDRRRVLRFAHMTDVHVQPERGADRGLIAALHHVQGLDDTPELIITGGDAIFDALSADAARTRLQWDLWQSAFKHDCGLDAAHCIGNHDIWGWNKANSGTTGEEPLWGRRYAIDAFGLDERYYSFDRAGWHFVVLDSVRPNGGGYLAYLDDEQVGWLEDDLKGNDRPTVVVTHVPILTVTANHFDDKRVQENEWRIPGSWVHLDTRRIEKVFSEHGNVKLCLSGHMHLVDRVEYGHVTYICDGAVSGNWWKGDLQDVDEGYGVVDLYDDGTFGHQYVPYGWVPVLPKPLSSSEEG